MKFEKTSRFFALTTGIVLSVLLVVGIVSAATTISTSITTGGSLTVSGSATLGDASGDVILSTGGFQASSTALFGSGTTFYGNLTVDKAATTTVTFNQAGINFDSNTFVIDPNANRVGVLTATPNTTLEVVGLASTTQLVVGGNGSTLGGVVFGTCVVDFGSITASTTLSANCTATGVRTSDVVFVTPTATTTRLIFTSASSTAANTIQVSMYNTGATGGVVDPDASTWGWMAIR